MHHMRALECQAFGDPVDVLRLREDYPTPGPPRGTEMLVRVTASSINPADYKRIKGLISWIGKPPFVAGMDIAGIVEEVGERCVEFRPGDRVFGTGTYRGGAMAELAIMKCGNAALVPSGTSMEEAAGMPVAGVTALQGLLDKAQLRAGQKLLVIGGSGGTGTFAVQIGKAVGAYVVATSSPAKKEAVEALGAREVFDHTDPNWWRRLEGRDFDVVFDCHGGGWSDSHRVLKRSGSHYVTIIGDDPNAPVTVPGVASMAAKTIGRKLRSFLGGPSYTFMIMDPSKQNLERLARFVQDGQVRTVIDKVYSLDEYADAFQHAEKGHPFGKVILRIAQQAPATE